MAQAVKSKRQEEVVFRLAVISRDVELSSNNDFESTLFQVSFATLFYLLTSVLNES